MLRITIDMSESISDWLWSFTSVSWFYLVWTSIYGNIHTDIQTETDACAYKGDFNNSLCKNAHMRLFCGNFARTIRLIEYGFILLHMSHCRQLTQLVGLISYIIEVHIMQTTFISFFLVILWWYEQLANCFISFYFIFIFWWDYSAVLFFCWWMPMHLTDY